MQFGVVFPQTEIGNDPGGVRAYVEAVEGLGYRHILAYDHVLGADPTVHRGWNGYYDVGSTFHEPLVLFGWVSGFTSLELVTGVLVGPQRQTALIAKQAAQVDLLSGGGRFRLGLGIGWNPVEYEALGQVFDDRGARLDEQVPLLRRLWTERSITHAGRFDTITGAGLAPLPPSRPIPIWLGATAPVALRRVGRIADGWFPLAGPGKGLEEAAATVADAARAAGRDPATIGMEGRLTASVPDDEQLRRQVNRWTEAGATHLSINTMRMDLGSVDQHLARLESVAHALGIEPDRGSDISDP